MQAFFSIFNKTDYSFHCSLINTHVTVGYGKFSAKVRTLFHLKLLCSNLSVTFLDHGDVGWFNTSRCLLQHDHHRMSIAVPNSCLYKSV